MAEDTSSTPYKKPTLFDVAKHSGFAYNTVSAILNGRKDSWASEKTKQKVIDAANKLGYVPNKLARNFRSGKSMTIGLVLANLQDPFYVNLSQHLTSRLNKFGYNVITEDTHRNPFDEAKNLEKMMGQYIDGAIYTLSVYDPHEEFFKKLVQRKMPLVIIGDPPSSWRVNSVSVSFKKGVKQMVDSLVGQGHKNFAFLNGLELNQPDNMRLGLFKDNLKKHKIKFDDKNIITCEHSMEGARVAIKKYFKELIKEGRQLPTAIFVLNDMLSVGAMRAMSEMKLKVPEDISIVGAGDIELGQYLQTTLSTISHPTVEVAKVAIETLLNQISNADAATKKHSFETSFILRESTGKARPCSI